MLEQLALTQSESFWTLFGHTISISVSCIVAHTRIVMAKMYIFYLRKQPPTPSNPYNFAEVHDLDIYGAKFTWENLSHVCNFLKN